MNTLSSSPPKQKEDLQETQHAKPKQYQGPCECVLQDATQKHIRLGDGVTLWMAPEGMPGDGILTQADDATYAEVDREQLHPARNVWWLCHAAQRPASLARRC